MKIIKAPRQKKKKTRGRYGEGSVYLNNGTYYFKIPREGDKPLVGSCKTKDYAEALDVLTRERARLAINRAPDASPQEREQTVTISDLLDLHLADLELSQADPDNITRRSIIDLHVRPYFGHMQAASLTPADLRKYRDKMTSEGYADATINRHFAALRRGYALGRQEGCIATAPVFKLAKENNRRRGLLRESDYPKLKANLPECVRPLLVFAYYTGIRSGELIQYTWAMVDFDKWLIRVPSDLCKNDEDRFVPILEGEMRDTLIAQKRIRDAQFPKCPWLFFRYGNVYSRRYLGSRIIDFRRAWDKAVKATGLEGEDSGRMFHDLRRTAVTNLIEEYGFSPEEACLISGHKTLTMVKRYRIGTEKSVLRIGERLAAAIKKKRERNGD